MHINVYLSAFSHHFASPLQFSARPSMQPTDLPLPLSSPSGPCPRLSWRLPRRIFSSFETAYRSFMLPVTPPFRSANRLCCFGRIARRAKGNTHDTHTCMHACTPCEEFRARVLRADRRVPLCVPLCVYSYLSRKSALGALKHLVYTMSICRFRYM